MRQSFKYLAMLALVALAAFGQAQTVYSLTDAAQLGTFTNDNTGATFKIVDAGGRKAMEVMPSGKAAETKVAIPLNGAALATYLKNPSQLELDVFLPEANKLNPDKFFLGMADVTGDWAWVDGVFSDTKTKPGWNTVVYKTTKAMQGARAERKYMLYLSFFTEKDGQKPPLEQAFYLSNLRVSAQAGVGVLYAMQDAAEVAGFTNDNTGAIFKVTDIGGRKALEVTPSGKAPETKLAIPLSGAKLKAFLNNPGTFTLDVYLPASNKLNPNKFFLGMGDVTGDWQWVDGVFSETKVQAGWNTVVYPTTKAMQKIKPEGKYMLYLSFFSEKDGNKTPLTETFSLANLGAAGPAAQAAPAPAPAQAPAALPVASAGNVLYSMKDASEIALLDNDKTGATFKLAEVGGRKAVEIMPSGKAPETKMAFPLKGQQVLAWMQNNPVQLTVELYLPEGTRLAPQKFFLGMADTTGGNWSWVDGVWSTPDPVSLKPGWNTIVYNTSKAMNRAKAENTYTLYFIFFHEKDGNKPPLTEPVYVGEIKVNQAAPAQSAANLLYTMADDSELPLYDNDKSGATFSFSDAPGKKALKITPSGKALETKIALPLAGERLAQFLKAVPGSLELDLYLPAEMQPRPNVFFMGMADVSGEWAWVDGIFASAEVKSGWNRIVYNPSKAMQSVKAEGKYMLYFALFNQTDGDKVPLKDPFYLGGLAAKPKVEAPKTEQAQRKEAILKLLGKSNLALLEEVQRRAFDYLWNEANPENGLVRDRSRPDSPSSIAAVGFALASIPVAVEHGWVKKEEGYQRVLTTLKTFAEGRAEGKNGFFYHFLDMKTGKRTWNSELSSIDTTLFIAGAMVAGQYFKGTEAAKLADELYKKIDWKWMTNGAETLTMGWTPEQGFLTARWSGFDEGILATLLGIGSATHPLNPKAWDRHDRNIAPFGYIWSKAHTLFVYQYPLLYFDARGIEDAYANYFENAVAAIYHNRCALLKSEFAKYFAPDIWGVSASDYPGGYRANSIFGIEGTVTPYASVASVALTPELSLASLRSMLARYPEIWGKYGLADAFNPDVEWVDPDYLGIDQGTIVLGIENFTSGLVWKLFMQSPYVQTAVKKIGFKPDRSPGILNKSFASKLKNLPKPPTEDCSTLK